MHGVRLAPLPPSVVCPSHPSCGWGGVAVEAVREDLEAK